jgi:quinol monooxygenase YgiN
VIAVAGLLQFKPEDRQAVLDGLKEVVRRSRQDPGCIDYWWSEDIETADAFRFFECWESQELMDAHMAQPHTEDFMSRCVSRVTNVDAYAYQVSDRQSAAG